ncbi:hypothetical protein GCM10027590_57770 [Nocardiopsis nanhaiensis]
MVEPLLTDPTVVLDEGALHDGDLPGWTAEGLQGDQEPGAQGGAEGDEVL